MAAAADCDAKQLEVLAYLRAHPELDADEQAKLRKLCAFLEDEGERLTEQWFEARVASGFSDDPPPAPRAAQRRDVDDWSPIEEPLL